MKKTAFYIMALMLGLSFYTEAPAQSGERVRIVLKSGVKVKNGILESFDDRMLKLHIGDTTPFYVRYDLIKKIIFKGHGTIRDDYQHKLSTPPRIRTNTFFHEIRGNLLFGEEDVSVGLHTINGYQFSRYLGTGLGAGLNKFGNYITVPLYASVKGYLIDKKTSPFYFGDVGYGFAWKTDKNDDVFEIDKMRGGLYWQIGLGYQINFYNSALVFTFGYVNQDSRMEYSYIPQWRRFDGPQDEVVITEKRLLRRFVFSIGFLL